MGKSVLIYDMKRFHCKDLSCASLCGVIFNPRVMDVIALGCLASNTELFLALRVRATMVVVVPFTYGVLSLGS